MIEGEMRSEASFAGIVRENFGLSLTEYRRMLELSLAKKKISVETDTEARELADKISKTLVSNKDMQAAIAEYADSDKVTYETTNSAVGRDNLDSGRAEMAFALEKVGDISEPFVSANGDGYYIVKLTAKAEDSVSYESIWIRFTMFDQKMQELREEEKVHERIKIDSDVAADEEEPVIDETVEE